jgi:hypothetical protein
MPSHAISQRLAERHGERQVGAAIYMPASGAWRLLFAQHGAGLPEHQRTWTQIDIRGSVACVVAAGSGVPEAVVNVFAGRSEA